MRTFDRKHILICGEREFATQLKPCRFGCHESSSLASTLGSDAWLDKSWHELRLLAESPVIKWIQNPFNTIQHYSTLFNIKLNHRHQMPTAKPIENSWNILTDSCPSPWDPSEDPGQLSPAPEFGDVQNWFVDTCRYPLVNKHSY